MVGLLWEGNLPKIFISYRRRDSGYPAQRIYEAVRSHFGEESAVFDVDTIPLGRDFRKYIALQVRECDVLLAVIGDRWVETLGQRLDKQDVLRFEVETALENEIPIVPVLVGNASMPREEDLPTHLVVISSLNASEVRAGPDLEVHVQRLMRGLDELLRAEAERKAEEEQARLRAEQEALEARAQNEKAATKSSTDREIEAQRKLSAEESRSDATGGPGEFEVEQVPLVEEDRTEEVAYRQLEDEEDRFETTPAPWLAPTTWNRYQKQIRVGLVLALVAVAVTLFWLVTRQDDELAVEPREVQQPGEQSSSPTAEELVPPEEATVAQREPDIAPGSALEKTSNGWTESLVGIEFVRVQGGSFTGETTVDWLSGASLTVGDFWLAKHEVTVGQFDHFVRVSGYSGQGGNSYRCGRYGMARPSDFEQTEHEPVVCVSHHEAAAMADWLTDESAGGLVYRLPTSAEWEFACRSRGRRQTPMSPEELLRSSWYESNSQNRTHPVGEKVANALGLSGMLGNATEWATDPWPNDPSMFVKRGGSWAWPARYSTCAEIGPDAGTARSSMTGFRLAADGQP